MESLLLITEMKLHLQHVMFGFKPDVTGKTYIQEIQR